MGKGPAPVTRYFVRLPNWLGDALMARPLLFALRVAFPAAQATALGPSALLELLAPDRTWDRSIPWLRGTDALGTIRAGRPELAVVCPPSFSSAWFAWRSGATSRVGFRGDGRDLLLTHPVTRPERGESHLSQEYLQLATALGIEAVTTPPVLATPAQADTTARQLAGDAPYAIVGPGAVYGPAKRWPAERFAVLARSLVERGWRVLACGAEGDREVCEEVAHRSGGGVTSLAGSTGLAVQAALCARAQVVVCNDSGLAHLAAATGAPTVSVFGFHQ